MPFKKGKIDELLPASGWGVLRFWETEINKDVFTCVDKIVSMLKMVK